MSEKIVAIFSKLLWHEKLKVLQTIEGWTLREAADKYGSSHRNVWAWNQGLQVPQRNSRAAIARAHGLAVTDIFPKDMLKPGEAKKGA